MKGSFALFRIVAFDQEMGVFCPDCGNSIGSVSSATYFDLALMAQDHQEKCPKL